MELGSKGEEEEVKFEGRERDTKKWREEEDVAAKSCHQRSWDGPMDPLRRILPFHKKSKVQIKIYGFFSSALLL